MAIRTGYTYRRLCQISCQLLIMVLGKILFMPVTKRDASLIDPALPHQPYIIVANHQKALDPFIGLCVLPQRYIYKIMPVNFMTSNFFYDSFIRPLLWMAGCYPARNPKNKHALFGVDGSITLLQNGFSVFIFPEGKRMRDGSRGPSHTGVTRIHHAMPDVSLLLCYIKHNKGIKALLTGKRFVTRYKIAEKTKYDNPESIMDELFAL